MVTLKDVRVVRYFNAMIKVGLVGMMMAIAGLTFYQVVMRYVFNSVPSWSEELIRFIFIWCSFIAAAAGVRERIHIGINVFVNMLPDRLVPLTEILVHAFIVVLSFYLIRYGWEATLLTQRQPSPALGLPMSWVYLSIPCMAILVMFYSVLEMIGSWRRFVDMRG